jgi:Secretion system C-terminal sorting domain
MARFFLTSILICLLYPLLFAQISYVTLNGAGAMDGTSWSNAHPANELQDAINEAASEVWVAMGVYRTTSGTDRTQSFHMRNGISIYGSFAGTETLLSQRNLSSGLTSTLSGEIGVAGISDNSYHVIHNTGLNISAVIDGFMITGANDNRPAMDTQGLGGGIYNNGNGSVCSPTIRNCVIVNNRAVFGAGIFNSGYLGGVASPVIINCVIAFNTAITGGGGIDNFGLAGTASPAITNTIFYENTAAERAGAMYCWGGNNGNASPVVINSVFVNNRAIDAGAVVADRLNSAGGSSGNSDPTFQNCIFWGNEASGTGPQFFLLGGATFNITYSAIDLTGQTAPHNITGAGTENVLTNPLFVSIASGAGVDGAWLTADDGLRLQSSSPCVDEGNNTGVSATDVLSNERIINNTADIGAYERSATVTDIEAEDRFNQISFYPNPASGSITFSGLTDSQAKVSILSLQGVRVKISSLHSNQFDISQLRSGVYILLVESKNKIVSRKLVVSK